MARLTAAQRKRLPASVFAGPGRSFPIPDKSHAQAALRLVGRSSLSGAQRAHVRARARRKLGA